LDHWHPFTDLELVNVATVDADAVRAGAELPADATIALIGAWRSDRTRLGGAGEHVELGTTDGVLRVSIEVRVPGAQVGGRLTLATTLVLRAPGADPSPISASRPGSILWTRSDQVLLEGGASRFPVTAVDFTTLPRLPDQGAWALEWSTSDLESPVSAALRLLVNAANSDLLQAIRSGATDARASLVRRFVTYDTARSLVIGALTNDTFVETPEVFEEGTLGRMLFELLSTCWPGIPISSLRARLREDPARLDAELQAHLGTLG
jgi:hypothetical protein